MVTGDATPAVYTVAEVAAILRCSPSTVYRLIQQRGLPVLRHGTWMRVPRHALNQWITHQAGTAEPSLEAVS